MGFKKATKSQANLRAAIHGPSGAGKTFTSLRVAKGLAGGSPIAVIDTERGSASKYADRFSFDVLELEDQTIDGYVAAISDAAKAGYMVLVIDSLSHGWQTLLEEVEKLAKAKYRGNTWSAWSEGTPHQRRLVQAILNYPGHVIATMRSKTEWTTVDNNGKKTPQRVGLAPEQGKGIEYEFDLLLEISTEHIGHVIKDRTGKFQDKLIDKPGEDFGQQLAAWLSSGNSEPAAVSPSGGNSTAAVHGHAAVPSTNEPLAIRIATHIAQATSVRTLGKIADRMEVLVSEGQLSPEEAGQLTEAVSRRHQQIEPEAVADGVA
jgi:hypothetical protein